MSQESFYVERLCKNKKCLEVAPGLGKFLAADPVNRLGVEIDSLLCDSLHLKGLNCINADFFNLNLSKKFDVIYSRNFIEHLDSQQLVKFIEKSSNLLSPGGNLILITPVESVIWRTASHIRPYPPISLHKLLNSKTENYIRRDEVKLIFLNSYCTFKVPKIKFLSFALFVIFNWFNQGSAISSSPPFSSHYIIVLKNTL